MFFRNRNCQEVGYAARRPLANSAVKAGSVSNKKKSTQTDKNNHGSANGSDSPKTYSKKVDKESSLVNAKSKDTNCHKKLPSRIEPQQQVKVLFKSYFLLHKIDKKMF